MGLRFGPGRAGPKLAAGRAGPGRAENFRPVHISRLDLQGQGQGLKFGSYGVLKDKDKDYHHCQLGGLGSAVISASGVSERLSLFSALRMAVPDTNVVNCGLS